MVIDRLSCIKITAINTENAGIDAMMEEEIEVPTLLSPAKKSHRTRAGAKIPAIKKYIIAVKFLRYEIGGRLTAANSQKNTAPINVNKAAAVNGFTFDRIFLIKMVFMPMNSDESKANIIAISNLLV
jgi:hypothetical protein